MTAFLPPNLLALFAPRDPIGFLAPAGKLGHEKKRLGYGNIANLMKEFENPKETPPPTRVETREEKQERKTREKAEQVAYKLEQDLAMWDPQNGAEITKDGFKTLFVARINYDSSESKLRREFESYGPIRKIRLVVDDKTEKPRGYAFIEYERERDMHNAYKNADGKKVDGRRVLVDVERGRTVKGWRPRRLGGGLGGTRRGGPDENSRFSGRDENGRRENDDRREEGGDKAEKRKRSRSPRENREKRVREERVTRRSRSRERKRRSRSRDKVKDDRIDRDGDEKKRKRRRSRSKDKERPDRPDRPDRPRRSRSRDRRRKRSRERGEEKPPGAPPGIDGQEYDTQPAEFGGNDTFGEEPMKEGTDDAGNRNAEGYRSEAMENGAGDAPPMNTFEQQYGDY